MTNRNQVRKEAVDLTVDTNLERQPKQQKLRNAEYYDMQDVMDKLWKFWNRKKVILRMMK